MKVSPTLDTKEVERVLKASGVKDVSTEKVEMAFQKVIDDKTYEMKASHIVPSYTSKSIKISNESSGYRYQPARLEICQTGQCQRQTLHIDRSGRRHND